MKSILLSHVTPNRNLPGIKLLGILPEFARTPKRCVWLCSQTRVKGAVLAVMARHRAELQEISVIEVSIPRRWVIRHSVVDGSWSCLTPIPPENFRWIRNASEWSFAPDIVGPTREGLSFDDLTKK